MKRLFPTLLSLIPAALFAAAPAATFDWPQWRGPTRDDISKETGLLKQWPAEGPKKLWSFTNAGQGYAGFSVAAGRVFTMGTRDTTEILLCLDAAKGTELWVAKLGNVLGNNWGDGPRGTPTVDGDKVYTLGGEGTLVCVNAKDGKEVWRTTMDALGGKRPNWGYTESVLIDGKQLVCTPGGAQGAVAALDKTNGKVLWQSKEFTDGAQYSSLVPATINGTPQYVQLTMQSVVGIAAKDGKVIWKAEWPGSTAVIPTPIVRGNQVFVTSGYDVGCKLLNINPDGSASEGYRNGNLANHHGGVVLVGDYVYGHSKVGSKAGWTCLDFKTGEIKWQERGKLGKGCIACADGMLYLLDEKTGDCVLLEPNPNAWTEKGRFKLDPQTSIRSPKGGVWTHPVVSNGHLYLRDQDLIHCYAVK